MIRPINKNDKEEYINMAKQFYSMPCCDHDVDPKHFEDAFEYCLNDNPYARLFIVEYDGKIAGYGNISFTYSIEAGGKVVWLEELFIKPQFQRLGLGKEFFDYVEKNFPAKRYRLEVTESNADAIRLYKKLGYNFLEYKQMLIDFE